MDLFENYLIESGSSPESIKVLISNVLRYRKFLDKKNITVENAGYNDLIAYIKFLQQNGIKQISIQHYINGLRHYYNYLRFHIKVIRKNPTDNIHIKGVVRSYMHDLFNEYELLEFYASYNKVGKSSLRNKCMLGLLIFQGLKSEELAKLQVTDINLDDKRIHIASCKRSNARVIELKSFQVALLHAYLETERIEILNRWNKESDKLFISLGNSPHFNNTMQSLMNDLRKLNSRIQSSKQLRASVLTIWTTKYNLRKVQYMAGHRYVSSTERYQLGNFHDLQYNIEKFHPIG